MRYGADVDTSGCAVVDMPVRHHGVTEGIQCLVITSVLHRAVHFLAGSWSFKMLGITQTTQEEKSSSLKRIQYGTLNELRDGVGAGGEGMAVLEPSRTSGLETLEHVCTGVGLSGRNGLGHGLLAKDNPVKRVP